jgi:putative intracellular protease/amidase
MAAFNEQIVADHHMRVDVVSSKKKALIVVSNPAVATTVGRDVGFWGAAARGHAKLAHLDLDEYDAIMVAGGLAPMFTFRDNSDVRDALRSPKH